MSTDEITALLRSRFSEDDLQMMAALTKVFRVLTSIYTTQSTDVQVVAVDICNFYGNAIPVEDIRRIVEDVMPILVAEGLLVNNQLTEEAVQVAKQHLQQFQ